MALAEPALADRIVARECVNLSVFPEERFSPGHSAGASSCCVHVAWSYRAPAETVENPCHPMLT
jgi:hypothetical protein